MQRERERHHAAILRPHIILRRGIVVALRLLSLCVCCCCCFLSAPQALFPPRHKVHPLGYGVRRTHDRPPILQTRHFCRTPKSLLVCTRTHSPGRGPNSLFPFYLRPHLLCFFLVPSYSRHNLLFIFRPIRRRRRRRRTLGKGQTAAAGICPSILCQATTKTMELAPRSYRPRD